MYLQKLNWIFTKKEKKTNKKEMFKEQRNIRRMSHYSILKWETLRR